MAEVSDISRRYRTRRKIVIAILASSLVVMGGVVALHKAGTVGIRIVQLATAVAAVGTIVFRVLWKCPQCRVFLQLSFKDSFCPKCGASFRDLP